MLSVKSCLLAVSLSVAVALAAGQEFPTAATAEMQRVGKQLEERCNKDTLQANEQRKNQPKTTAEPDGVAQWLSNLTDDAGYCACMSNEFVRLATPETLRREQDVPILIKKAGTNCVLPKLRTGFPKVCQAMMTPPP